MAKDDAERQGERDGDGIERGDVDDEQKTLNKNKRVRRPLCDDLWLDCPEDDAWHADG